MINVKYIIKECRSWCILKDPIQEFGSTDDMV